MRLHTWAHLNSGNNALDSNPFQKSPAIKNVHFDAKEKIIGEVSAPKWL